MGLYNLLFGMNPDADKVLSVLGKTRGDFGRFRDVYLEDGYIVVHTRNGGGNRESYESVFDEMSQHPWYSHDEDDDFDCTYANIYFKVPEGREQTLMALRGLDEGGNPAEQWNVFLDALQKKE
jgi:hypothetical protein